MKRWMTFFDRDEDSTARRANFSASAQRSLNRRAVSGPSRTDTIIDNVRRKRDWAVGRRWSQKLNRIFGSHGARRTIRGGALHQMISGGPVAVTIEQRPDDSAI